jgi:hypothetical protein
MPFEPGPLDDAEDTNVSPPTTNKAEIIKNLESVALAANWLNSCLQE